MTETGPDMRPRIPKAQMINDATVNSLRPVFGVLISKALRDEIRATRGWLRVQAVVDPRLQGDHFEVITNKLVWEERTARLKEADLVPYSALETAYVRIAIVIFIGGAIALCALGYFIFSRYS